MPTTTLWSCFHLAPAPASEAKPALASHIWKNPRIVAIGRLLDSRFALLPMPSNFHRTVFALWDEAGMSMTRGQPSRRWIRKAQPTASADHLEAGISLKGSKARVVLRTTTRHHSISPPATLTLSYNARPASLLLRLSRFPVPLAREGAHADTDTASAQSKFPTSVKPCSEGSFLGLGRSRLGSVHGFHGDCMLVRRERTEGNGACLMRRWVELGSFVRGTVRCNCSPGGTARRASSVED
ncbi:hypothetical protein LXA43DRAFT_307096 [Ganoderma leucocontextum]|nr:hypothetical protein LXA43DRAFT_307096 [Ganoderma leucocontextum]